MTAEAVPSVPVARRRRPRRVRVLATTIRAVVTRELRWRMRGRRAYVVATMAVLFMGLFVLAIHQFQLQRAIAEADDLRRALPGDAGLTVEEISGAASVRIGRAIFAGLLGLLTVITLVVAPALASGMISTEREKQTLELLVTVPISTLGLVIGKLVASLAYVLLLIAASLPLMCLAFAFGGIGVDDILSAYALVLAVALGTAALGLYLSAVMGRTQIAALTCYLILVGMTGATMAASAWLTGSLDVDRRLMDGNGDHGVAGRDDRRAELRAIQAERRQLGRIILVANPLAAPLDVVCSAMPEVEGACTLSFRVGPISLNMEDTPRLEMWPRAALGWVLAGGTLTLLTTQHISASRRLGLWRRLRRRIRRTPRASPPQAP